LDAIYLLISAGTGPEECAWAASQTLKKITQESDTFKQQGKGLNVSVIEIRESRVPGNIRSALLEITGGNANDFAISWTGTIQWVWQSVYRPHPAGISF